MKKYFTINIINLNVSYKIIFDHPVPLNQGMLDCFFLLCMVDLLINVMNSNFFIYSTVYHSEKKEGSNIRTKNIFLLDHEFSYTP